MQILIVEHNVRIAQLNTRLAQLHSKLNSLQKNQSMKEQVFTNQIDQERLNVFLFFFISFHLTLFLFSKMMAKSQIGCSISSLYDRYHLVQQTKADHELNIIEKLKFIEVFIYSFLCLMDH